MGLSALFSKLDDRVLGDRLRGEPQPQHDDQPVERRSRERVSSPSSRRSGNGVRKAVGIVYKVFRLVFALLALAMVLGIVFTLAPSNPDNVIVRNVLEFADTAAGPFKDVFTIENDPERQVVVNYSFAGAIYLVAALLVTRLPGSDR